ncbi:hypothetical protein [Methylobacterium sp. 77]|uniref:hypothetical protein n=1 Tax=Methylobacterium sp. 77 TaxID=1101192 RepID=UPI0003606F77|nr:hypothetical protein [Methylobacterium sp. 77]
MSTRSDHGVLNGGATSFDPYGEPVCDDRTTSMTQGDRRARNVAIAVFWMLALTLTAGRVYFSDQSLGQTLTLAQAQIASYVTAIR